MEEPLCHAHFDFEFERTHSGGGGAGGRGADGVIPRAELQAMMFTEMQELLASPSYAMPSPASRVSMGSTGGGQGGGARAEGKYDDDGIPSLSSDFILSILSTVFHLSRMKSL
jgi:hypothetical protein